MVNPVNNTPNFKGTFHVYNVGGIQEYGKLARQLNSMENTPLTKDEYKITDYSGVNDTFTLETRENQPELDLQIYKVISNFTGLKTKSHFDYNSRNNYYPRY